MLTRRSPNVQIEEVGAVLSGSSCEISASCDDDGGRKDDANDLGLSEERGMIYIWLAVKRQELKSKQR